MRLKQALFWKIHCFKEEPLVEFEIRLTLNQCIFQRKLRRAYSIGASFYVEKIKLASKLRELYQKWSFCQLHSSVLFAIFLATERCLCYANLVWIIYILSQAFRTLLSTTQFSFVCYFLETEMCLCYANLIWIIYILSQAFPNLLSTTQLSFVCYFLSNWKVSMLCQTRMDYLHFESSFSKSFVNHTTQFCLLFS